MEPSLWECWQHQDTWGKGWRAKPDPHLWHQVSLGASRSCSPSLVQFFPYNK